MHLDPTTKGRLVHTVDTEKARQLLEATLAELDRSVATLDSEVAEPDHQGTPGDADAGLDLADSERARALVDIATQQRDQVVAALERIDRGVYGRCVICDTALPPARLEAKPEAARCLSCQARSEAAH